MGHPPRYGGPDFTNGRRTTEACVVEIDAEAQRPCPFAVSSDTTTRAETDIKRVLVAVLMRILTSYCRAKQ